VKRTTVSVFLSSLVLPAVAGAQPLGPVVVTATRTANPADQVLANVDVIGGDELLRLPAADLGDALRMRAGVEVARLGGPGQQTSVFLRGTDSNHVLVLVDGLRINPGTIGSAAIQNIPPDQVERVEIVKGPRSALYGSDAIGGVINVITRKGTGRNASVQAGFGRYDSKSASLAAGIGDERADASIGLSWLDSAGFPTRTGDGTDRGYENLSVNGAVRASVGGVALGLRAWHASGTSEYSDFFVTPVDQDFANAAFATTAGFAPTAIWQSSLMAGYALDFVPKRAVGLPSPLPSGMGAQAGFQLIGDMTLHGVTKEVTWNVVATFGNDMVGGRATLTTDFETFNITKPTLARLMSVDDKIELEIEFRCKRSVVQ
jgi:vitamin B12 transporter